MIETIAHPRAEQPGRAPRHVPGEAGLWVFILGDMTMFALLFGAFLYARQHQPAAFAAGRAQLSLAIGAINTLVLLTSSLLVALAPQAHRAKRPAAASRMLAGAGACALTFVALKAIEWTTLISSHPHLTNNHFFAYYFALTGLHLLHLMLGTAGLALVHRTFRRGSGQPRDRLIIEAGCSYWHMVDLVWVLIFPLVYLAST
jgi:nitric oxide reductase NorE protein